ncbi:UDP-N-acetylmuramate dehydrogenase [Leptospira paudalimensis]|uniref:UDP-N-acetylenolpyruvoylglucosamine reductase n=1 Tax=Leptospira paudalimensis TaxID=2950024 RepID=A0ABT3MC67_9LEPT|nr:UDP-N-acetylmuramate dehydrogenase [Leptospira paudalimensis]MCW7505804.1 UDP-N-acetylmuramate dehydrogenase [Leptospira paudalimensis]
MLVQNDIPLAPYTTFRLGGEAKYFISIKTKQDVKDALLYCRNQKLPYMILGGGSNTIIRDSGFDGVVLQIQIPGIRCLEANESSVIYEVGAGVIWDQFVEYVVKQGLTGNECLSGIPGSVGASPIQNIGAYGQEVKDTIISIQCLDEAGNEITISNEDCNFTYRNSEFKSGMFRNWIVCSVTFQLSKQKEPCILYPEVKKQWEILLSESKEHKLDENLRTTQLESLRNLIIGLRKKKSMVLDENDPNTRSAGSFFTNPILADSEIQKFLIKASKLGYTDPPMYHESNGTKKLSAAWLIEHSGIKKGDIFPGGVGISTNHCLGLININGTANALLSMAESIQKRVFETFSIHLEREPVVRP